MRLDHPSVHMIEIVAKALGDLKDKVVFVGGSTVPFYLEDEGTQDPRPTTDVDCILEIASYFDYGELDKKLRSKGFSDSHGKNDPICRWKVGGVTVDVMPTDEKIIGFSNMWYKEGIKKAIEVNLTSGTSIRIFSPPYFIASKFEAFLGRGQGDFRTSHDFEDVVTLLDGLISFDPIYEAPETVKVYIKEKFKEFTKNDTFLESISGHLEQGSSNSVRTKRIVELINYCESM